MVSMSTLLVTRNDDKSVTTSFEEGEFLGEGDLIVDVSYSSLNYKDAMAIAGDRGVMRTPAHWFRASTWSARFLNPASSAFQLAPW